MYDQRLSLLVLFLMEYFIHSLGGQETAKINRSEALARYYANPKICLNCQKIIQMLDNSTAAETRRKKFCNKSCSAQYRQKLKKTEKAEVIGAVENL